MLNFLYLLINLSYSRNILKQPFMKYEGATKRKHDGDNTKVISLN